MAETEKTNGLFDFDLKSLSGTEDAGEALRNGMIGASFPFESPFGKRQIVYADWTASGRALEQVERYVQTNILPWYANTHTTSSCTGARTTESRAQAREYILRCVNGSKENDVVFFSGSGSTAAINKWVQLIQVPEKAKKRLKSQRPLILVGTYEHHSNLLPWRESGAKVIIVPENPVDGCIDIKELEKLLKKNARRQLIVGSFSAASNILGVMCDVKKITKVLHKYGALACFDYACGAPYIKMDMNPTDPDAAPDAIFISPHKFIGGVNTSGVLVCKRAAIKVTKPSTPHVGGGTVLWVTGSGHGYLSDVVEREEGGTPDIVGNIRTGLTFAVKESFGSTNIEQREEKLVGMIRSALVDMPNLTLLGPPIENNSVHRLPIMSFIVKVPDSDYFLHHGFVSAILNDVYGINSRAGCMCAGPLVVKLLGFSQYIIDHIEYFLTRWPHYKPGFTRLSLAYFITDEEVNFILHALKQVSVHGWKLLPFYEFNKASGEWSFVGKEGQLKKVDLVGMDYTTICEQAEKLYEEASNRVASGELTTQVRRVRKDLYPVERQHFVWFLFPEDVVFPADKPDWKQDFVRPDKYWPKVNEQQLIRDKKKSTIGKVFNLRKFKTTSTNSELEKK